MEMVVEGRNQARIAPNQIMLEETMEKWEEDRISALPDCLLVEILSRIPSTEDAIKTGTLSKRWEHLWTSVHNVIFIHTESDDSLNPSATNPKLLSDFVSFMDKSLTQCRGVKLKRFVLCTTYEIQFEPQFNNWLHYAIGCDVEEISLSFSTSGSGVEFRLDQKFFTSSSFINLNLSGCVYNPTGPISWKNLKRLWISCDVIDEDLIANILSGSPVLEILALNYCSGFKRLDITSKSVKSLMFNSYMNPSDPFYTSIVEINAPNILSLSIRGTLVLWKLLLVNVSSLVQAGLDYRKLGHYETTHEEAEEEMLRGLIVDLRHVPELYIAKSCHEVLSRLASKDGLNFSSDDSSDNDSVESGDCDSVDNVHICDVLNSCFGIRAFS